MNWGIYGPGILNDTVVPGYGVTKFPVNLSAFQALNDGTTRNFGQATQYVTYGNPMMSPLEQMLAFQFTSPNHISQYDPMLFSLNPYMMMGGMGMSNPFMMGGSIFNMGGMSNPYMMGGMGMPNMGCMYAYQAGAQMAMQMQINSLVQSFASALASLENGLTELLNNKNIPASFKSKIQSKLEKVKQLKLEIANALRQNPSKTVLEAIGAKIKALQEEVSKLADEIAKELRARENGDHSDGTDGTDGDGTTDNNGRPSGLGDAPKNSELETICSEIDGAYAYAWGTDKEKLDNCLNQINEGNVIEIISHWNDNYKTNSSKDSYSASWNDGEFFASLMDELNDEEESSRVPILLNAMVKRAEMLGIYDDIQSYVSAVRQELNKDNIVNWFGRGYDDKKIIDNLKNIYQKIVDKEKTNKTEADTNNTQKAEERKQEVIAEKTQEFRNEVRKNITRGTSLPELNTAFKVITDDNGEFVRYELKLPDYDVPFKGSTYNELVENLREYGVDPKDALVKRAVRA